MPSGGFSPEWHHRKFLEFSRYEVASGGPDPHMKLAVHLALRNRDPLWVAGVYTAPYVVSTALAITNRWTRRRVLEEPQRFAAWVNKYWASLPIRKERKVNGVGPGKLAEVIGGYARWLEEGGLDRILGLPFQQAFDVLDPLHYGRYFKMKLYEVLRRTLAGMGDGRELPAFEGILPKNAPHPRKGLALLFPAHDYKSNSAEDLCEANDLSEGLMGSLNQETDGACDWFVTEVLLCNYRQAVAGGQYPGRAQDSELGHYHAVCAAFPDVDAVLVGRAELFEEDYLGEVGNRWLGRRKELGKVMTEHNYVWSDGLYDYCVTSDLANPAEKCSTR